MGLKRIPHEYYLNVFEPKHDSTSDEFQKVNSFWFERWERISRLKKLSFTGEELKKKDFVIALMSSAKNEIALMMGFRIVTPLTLRVHHDPVADYLSPSMPFFKMGEKDHILLVEANTLNADYSFRKTHDPLVEIAVLLGGAIAASWDVDWCVAFSRTITGVQDTANSLGFISSPQKTFWESVPVEVQAVQPKQMRAPTPEIARMVEKVLAHPKSDTWRTADDTPIQSAA